ncbi:MAG: MerR family transcriptional regulator [Dorea sp.]|nr:MerR family transcriptional regulator [Dorea sp.]
MNTKQIEELTGITRQNIRYYERQNLLEPVRDAENAYRDYSEEDVRRLKLIKMLRMLDMPLKEIEQVLNGTVLLKEAIERQQENLAKQQKQLQAALEVCTDIRKDKSESIDVDGYLNRMEQMAKGGGVFARIVDDYKQVAQEESSRQISFYSEQPVNTAGMLEQAIRTYAKEQHKKLQMKRPGMYPELTLDGIPYTAVRVLEKDGKSREPKTRIVLSRADDGSVKKEGKRKRRAVFQAVYSIGVNIRRHRARSILNAVISMMTVVVLVFYFGTLQSTRQQFEELPEAIPVRGTFMNATGKLKNGLLVRPQVLDMVYGSPYLWKIQETAELVGHIVGGGSGEDTEVQVVGVNCPDLVQEYSEEEINWAKGWNWDRFLGSEHVCITGKTFLEMQDADKGSSISLSLEHYQPADIGVGLKRLALGCEDAEIVGTLNDTADAATPGIILPLDAVKQLYQENGETYFASSLSFTVKDPMNLNALKQDLKEEGLSSVVPELTDTYMGSAVRIEDDVFIQAAIGMEKNISLLEAFLPFLLMIVILAGYLVPHLLLQGRRSEYAIMRALGTGRKRCTVIFFAEHILLAMAGGAAGAAIGIVFGTAGAVTAAVVWILFLIFYMLGAAAAMWMFGKMSIAAVLSHRD